MSQEIVEYARTRLVQRGQTLSYLTIGYNCLEGVAATVAGLLAGSVALVGFGVDSGIEVASSLAALWRLSSDVDHARRGRAERLSMRVIGICFLVLACYLLFDATHRLYAHSAPQTSVPGIVVATLSLIVMPALSRAKRRVATGLESRALSADATQTDLCAYLAAIVLGGLVLNAVLGWWWADPVAALAISPIIAREGIAGVRAKPVCAQCP